LRRLGRIGCVGALGFDHKLDQLAMPTIVFMSSKGGTGKTTAALTLAIALARRVERIALIDADANLPLQRWRAQAAGLSNLSVHAAPTGHALLAALDQARAAGPWLIADTEGSPRAWDQVGVLAPDLVLIPVGPSPLEAAEAVRTSRSLRNMAGFFDRPLPHACVFTRLPAAIRARSFGQVVEQLRAERIAMIETPLIEKEAFRAMFRNGGTLESLGADEVSGLDAARANADRFAADIISLFAPGGPLSISRPASGWPTSTAAHAGPMHHAA
jgi:chromosome partitioning protein